jgi:uroporphyrin-III C-methyltransferase
MESRIKEPKITLVGAGPGDPELITLKGLKAIRQADVILYDALVNEECLNEAPNAKIIFVGKRRGQKALTQKEINSLIVDSALKFGHVVRLKGGDSFVFGRGFEEIQFIQLFGIKVDVIPGISSSIAVPALANIPVTHRGISNHFTVITATLSDGSLNPDIDKLAQLGGTLVILMGLNKLDEITTLFCKAGKDKTPFAVISNGSLKSQRTVIGTAKSISKQVNLLRIPAPATIVVGEVITLGENHRQTKSVSVNYN